MIAAKLKCLVLPAIFALTSGIAFATNSPPVVTLTQPLSNHVFAAASDITLQAVASDSDGSIALVEFFEGLNKLGESTNSPYNFTWLGVAAGAYALTAVATDNEGAATTSVPIPILVNTAPAVAIASPSEDANFTSPASVPISAVASDDGSVTNVEFFVDAIKVAETASPPYDFSWTGAGPGIYALTVRATDNLGLSTLSDPVTIFVTTNGGALAGIVTAVTPGAEIDLSSEGTNDWVHWGRISEKSFTRKLGVDPQISNFNPVGVSDNEVYQYSDNANGYSWTDGTPTLSATNTTTGLFVVGLNNGYEITVPASTNAQTLRLYLGSYGAHGKLRAYLSDFTAPIYLDSSLDNSFDGPGVVYTLTYSAASSGQMLNLRYTAAEVHTALGNVTLQAATLSQGNVPPSVLITNPVNNLLLGAPANISLAAQASDTDGTISKVEFFQGTTKIGEKTNSPYSLTWSNVAAGSYVLTARAIDNGGVALTSPAVNAFVTNAGGFLSASLATPAAAVDLTREGKLDWTHWGLEYPINPVKTDFFNRRRNVSPALINYALIPNNGGSTPFAYTDNLIGYSWTDGTPIINANNSTTGIYKTGLNEGFRITVPADTTLRRLKVYVGVYRAQGKFEATLSDFSAAPYIDSSLVDFNSAVGVYTINYAAASSGKSLTVKYTSTMLFNEVTGNITLQAATLASPIPALSILNPLPPSAFAFSFPTEFNLKYAVQFTDSLNPTNWQTLTNFTGDGLDMTVTDPSNYPQRYYRVKLSR